MAISLRQALPRIRTVLGHVTALDLAGRTATISPTGQDGSAPRTERWDRLVLVPGSVTRQFDIPGVTENGHGIKTLTEAQFLRDHLLRQLDLADGLPDVPDTYEERRERLTVVAVGAGYTGTETVAQLQRWLHTVASRWHRIRRRRRALAADRRRRQRAARARPGAGRRRAGHAAPSGGRRPAGGLRRVGHRPFGHPHRRQHRAVPHADLGRRGHGQPADRHARPGAGARQAGGRRRSCGSPGPSTCGRPATPPRCPT